VAAPLPNPTPTQTAGPAGFEVIGAATGLEALEKAPAFGPTAVLLDIGLPDLSGYEVARRLRQNPNFASTLLIVLTGYDAPEARALSAAAGFDQHMSKPVNFEELTAFLAQVLDGRLATLSFGLVANISAAGGRSPINNHSYGSLSALTLPIRGAATRSLARRRVTDARCAAAERCADERDFDAACASRASAAGDAASVPSRFRALSVALDREEDVVLVPVP
jgi:DNA-binding response OmpR family regulator